MRRAARTDANQRTVVEALQRIGASVTSLASVGGGVPDLLVSFRGKWHVMEIKDGSKTPSQRRLTAAQRAWHPAQQAPVHVVESVADAMQALGVVIEG